MGTAHLPNLAPVYHPLLPAWTFSSDAVNSRSPKRGRAEYPARRVVENDKNKDMSLV
jgi:hypothetical protein